MPVPPCWDEIAQALAAKGLIVLGEPRRGGMGWVVRVRDTRLAHERAVKLLTSADDALRARFLREARIGVRLSGHENVMRCFDHFQLQYACGGFAQSNDCILMEWLKGDDVAEYAKHKGKPLPLETALQILGQSARRIAALHSHGIVHRDIKPSNLYLVRGHETKSDWVKVTDFGIAKELNATIADYATITGGFLGTPGYAAPEPADHAGYAFDLFSLGVVAYELINGSAPFGDADRVRLSQGEAVAPPGLPRTVPATVAK